MKIPVLLAHGTADDYIPSWMSQNLYDAAAQPKHLVLVPGIDHGQIGKLIAGREFTAAMQQLFDEVARRN